MSPSRGVGLRDWLVRFLFGSTAIQSFDGLVQRAARYQQFGTSGPAAEWLPRLWAATIDVIWYAGLLGIQRYGGRDWLSWVAFVVAFGASFGFQVAGAKDVPVAAVPPVALLLVLVVMHAPRRGGIASTSAAAEETAGSAGNAAPGVEDHGGTTSLSVGTGGVPGRAELSARRAVEVDREPTRREPPRPAGNAVVPAPPSGGNTVPASDPDRAMRAYWAAERAKGRTPSGAELDRVVGRNPDNGAGRKARARYLREEAEGRFTAPVDPADAVSAVPAEPFPVGTSAAPGAAGNDRGSLRLEARQTQPAVPDGHGSGNGHPAREVVPVVLEAFAVRHNAGETTDA